MTTEFVYRDLYSQMTGIRRLLYATGRDILIDCLGNVTIIKVGER